MAYQAAFLFSLVIYMPHLAAKECKAILEPEATYMALSSDERGCSEESPLFREAMDKSIALRAGELCKLAGCGPSISVEVEEAASKTPLRAKTLVNLKLPALIFSRSINPEISREEGPIALREFRSKKAWTFGNNGRRHAGNTMWYVGHTLSLTSPLSFLSGPLVVIIGPVWIAAGGALTTVSRVVERTPAAISVDQALRRTEIGKKINKKSSFFGARVPHLVFKQIHCQSLESSAGATTPAQ